MRTDKYPNEKDWSKISKISIIDSHVSLNVLNSSSPNSLGSGIDEEKKEDDSMSLNALWKAFYNYTSFHGIPNIGRAKSSFKKALWTLATIGSVVFFFLNLAQLYKKYWSYEVDLALHFFYGPELVFPAVTLCNNNPIKKSMARKYLGLQELADNYSSTLKNHECQTFAYDINVETKAPQMHETTDNYFELLPGSSPFNPYNKIK